MAHVIFATASIKVQKFLSAENAIVLSNIAYAQLNRNTVK